LENVVVAMIITKTYEQNLLGSSMKVEVVYVHFLKVVYISKVANFLIGKV
jgi:hypothetical protein